MKKLVYVSIGLLIAIVVISALAMAGIKKNKGGTASPTPTPTTTQKTSPTQGETVEVQVLASDYSYSPSSIKVNKGDTLRITLRNVGKMPHNLVFEASGKATKTILPGQSDTIEITVTESGQSKFYCSLPGHRALGMEGDLEVK